MVVALRTGLTHNPVAHNTEQGHTISFKVWRKHAAGQNRDDLVAVAVVGLQPLALGMSAKDAAPAFNGSDVCQCFLLCYATIGMDELCGWYPLTDSLQHIHGHIKVWTRPAL